MSISTHGYQWEVDVDGDIEMCARHSTYVHLSREDLNQMLEELDDEAKIRFKARRSAFAKAVPGSESAV